MYMIRTSIASVLVVLGALSAKAQSAQELQLLRQNPALAQQFMGSGGVLQQDAQTQNIPTAPNSRTLNAEDALNNQGVLLQSQARPTTEESVIQRYYRILAGELLDVYGAQEFGQQQDNQLLFFKRPNVVEVSPLFFWMNSKSHDTVDIIQTFGLVESQEVEINTGRLVGIEASSIVEKLT